MRPHTVTLAAALTLTLLPRPTPMDSLQAQTPEPVALHRTEVHVLRSRHVGADFQLRVALPVAPFAGGPAPEPRGVLYLLDGDLWFGTATVTTRLLHQFMGELPPLLVVGIGYGEAGPALQGELRTRDYTPTSVAEYAAMARAVGGGRRPVLPEDEAMGGADAFLDFLEDEAIPFVEERWEVAGTTSTLFGSSLGGLLGAWGLLTRPGLVDGWILTSAALWWDDGVALERERAHHREGGRLQGRIYLAAGAREEGTGIPQLDAYRLVSNTRLLARRLTGRDDPGLDVTLEIIPGETHTSVVPTALLRGLRTLYPRASRPEGS